LGASTAYVESTLGQIYKQVDPVTGQYRGGPAYYFEHAKGWKIYGIIFALASIVSCGLFLPGVQANGVVKAVTNITGEGAMVATNVFGDIGVYTLVTLAAILLLLGFIIFGGIKRIANVTQLVVPFMALGYIILALIIIFINYDRIPEVFGMIVGDAFTAQAGLGAAIGWGVKRGVYSNEAGQGTGPHAAAAAEVQHPTQQGLVQAFSVYVDTLFVCSATAFMILMTGQYNIQGTLPDGQFLVQNLDAAVNINSPAFTQAALTSVFGSSGEVFVGLAVFFFAFTTLLAYYYIAETNVAYLAEKIGFEAPALFVIKVVLMAAVAYGAINSSGYIWNIGDIGVGLMAWLNIVGIIALFFLMGKPTIKCLRDYEAQKKAGVKDFTFDPKALGIENARFWEQRLEQREKR
ncbi:MAG: alanine:cation symporter family protein, partial [Thiothrix sp.]|nr:alanine:cation symporter family protein [Thiothrix sp.]